MSVLSICKVIILVGALAKNGSFGFAKGRLVYSFTLSLYCCLMLSFSMTGNVVRQPAEGVASPNYTTTNIQNIVTRLQIFQTLSPTLLEDCQKHAAYD
jgi:hypothetical protein